MRSHPPYLLLSLAGLLVAGFAEGCASNPRTPADAGTVSGTLTYRERVALPPDAVIQVQLSDVSVQDVAAPLIAETTIRPEGRQVPLSFELRYDPSKIEPNRTYAVRATIRSEGRLMFTTSTVVPVITQGNPTTWTSCSSESLIQREPARRRSGSRPECSRTSEGPAASLHAQPAVAPGAG